MAMTELTKAERDGLLAEYADIRNRLREVGLLDIDERRALDQRGDAVLDEYVNRLPLVPIGRCPFQGELTLKRMDVFGLDGKWWYVGAPDLPPQACIHYVTFLGALNLNGNPPVGCSPRAIHEIEPGPDVPFVIPRLLQIPGMAVVISSRQFFDDQFTAYFMTYYNQKPVPGWQSHQTWLRSTHSFQGAQGQPNWDAKTDRWDFDLDQWRMQPDKVFWVAPGDRDMKLRLGSDPAFPYANLPGMRLPQRIRQGKVRYLPLPDGQRIEPGD
jgi:hypothetical protein